MSNNLGASQFSLLFMVFTLDTLVLWLESLSHKMEEDRLDLFPDVLSGINKDSNDNHVLCTASRVHISSLNGNFSSVSLFTGV